MSHENDCVQEGLSTIDRKEKVVYCKEKPGEEEKKKKRKYIH